MKKIALAMIVRPDDKEAELLARCLGSVGNSVDAIFITQAGESPNKKVSAVCTMFGATESFFKWNGNFSDARNFSYQQVPEEYHYRMFLDADDILLRGARLREVINDEKYENVDVFSMWYVYDQDKWGNPTVVHHRPFITVNDGTFSWKDPLHEYLHANREVRTYHIEGPKVVQITKPGKNEERAGRNYAIAKIAYEKNPNDARAIFNYAKSCAGKGEHETAAEMYRKFAEQSDSDEEKYLSRVWAAESLLGCGKDKEAEEQYRLAIGTKPNYPDAYIHLGRFLVNKQRYWEAIELLKTSLQLPPPYTSIVVYNPRDYDYTPIRLLATAYLGANQPLLAYDMFELLLKITPRDEDLKNILSQLKEKRDLMEKALELVEKANKEDDTEKKKKLLNSVPFELKYHPAVCALRNQLFVRTESTGKDVAFFCGYTSHEWNPEVAEKQGVGGSEEAVIHLSKRLVARGFSVSVFCNCGTDEKEYDGVRYLPFQAFNYRDRWDTLILWRHPHFADYELNAGQVFVDMHDVISPGEFTKKRLSRITKVFFKSKFHRELFQNIPEEKAIIVGNGIVAKEFLKDEERDPYLLINTSSPDRSLDVLLSLFRDVKKRVPQARLHWAYGWGVYDSAHAGNKEREDWKKTVVDNMKTTEGFTDLGKLNHREVAALYRKAKVFAYPTEFAEIDCISAKKAQAAGAIPVCTDFAALETTVEFGHKVHSPKTVENWSVGRASFGLEGQKEREEWVDACVKALGEPPIPEEDRKRYAYRHDWENVADFWCGIIKQCQ